MKSVFILMLPFLILTFSASGQHHNQITGKWLSEGGDSQIEIFQKSNKYFGKIIWLREPNQPNGKPKVDKNNSNSELREIPILGLEIISSLEYDGEKWVNGKIYSPKEGQTVNCSKLLLDESTLKVTVSKFLFSTTKIWKRL